VGFDPNPAGRSTRLTGLLVDREFGLAAWQPAWLVAVPALAALATRPPRRAPFLLVPAAAGWLNATFVALTMHGWWWPGRQVVVVLPLIVVAVAGWAGAARGHLRWATGLGVAGIFSWAWLTYEVLARRLTLIVDFYETSNPLYRAWSSILPGYRTPTMETWILHTLWIALVAAGLWWGRTFAARRP
ncbi:MAG TPA: hypothetical protein VEU29_06860, partial [Actinomycetota bacterium]|nr:hypothetical protein [Actinomycetota bacterium]